MQIHCRRGDLAAVRNHLRTEHDMVKYEVELVLHLCLISNEEHDSLIKTLSFRLDKFVEEGTFDKDINLFESKTKEEKLEPGDGVKAMETLDETAYRSLPETSTPLPKLQQPATFAEEKELQVLEDKTLSDSTSSEVEIVGTRESEGNSESPKSAGLEVDELTLSVDDDEFEDVEEEVTEIQEKGVDNIEKKQESIQEYKEINLKSNVCESPKEVDVNEKDKESNEDKGEKSEDIELLILTDEPDANRDEVEMEETDKGVEKTDIKTKQCVVKLAKVSKVNTESSEMKPRVRTRSVIAKETSESKAKRRGEKVEEPTRKMVRRK